MWLVAGLGNPGGAYERTPHNLGFDVVDAVARRRGLAWKVQTRFQAMIAEGGSGSERLFLMKPLTYMNLSGEAVLPLMHFYKIEQSRLLVVCDDVALPMGRIRLRTEGSDGGHKGLRSIELALGSNAYARLRIGIEPSGVKLRDLKSFVLQKMFGEYLLDAQHMVEISADCVEAVLSGGFVKAANAFNGYDARKQSS